MLRFYFIKIHAICGLLVSLLLVLMALTGIFLVFRNEFVLLSLGQLLVPRQDNNFSGLVNILSNLDLGKVKSIVLPDDSLPLYKVIYGDNVRYYDLSGGLLDNQPISNRFDEVIFKLHHYLLAGDTGEIIVGTIGLLLLFMILSGIYLIVPLVKNFEFRLLPKSSLRRDIISHHRNLGLVFAPLLLLIAISGSAMIFNDTAKSILGAITNSKPAKLPKLKVTPTIISAENINHAVIAANVEFPNGKVRIIAMPKKPDEPLTLRVRQNREWHSNGRTFIAFLPSTGKILSKIDGLKLDRATNLYNAFYPLHSGRGIGLWYKVILALTGLALLLLGIFATFSYGRKLIKTGKI